MAKLTLKLDTRRANKAGGVSHQTVADPYAGCRKYVLIKEKWWNW